MFKYYQRSTNLTEPDQVNGPRAENATFPPNNLAGEQSGPVQVTYGSWATPIASWIQLAFREVGIPDAPSQINGAILGSQYNPVTQNLEKQTRESSQTSYLDASFRSGRTNLKVYKRSLAQRILFNSKKEASGVIVQGDSNSKNTFVLSAKKEVILSAGVFQSPQLLMVSGVGPKETLQKFNIPVIADRPGVGQQLIDHTVFNLAQEVNVQTYTRLQGDAAAVAFVNDEFNNNSPPEGILTSQLSDLLAWENLPESYRGSFTAETKAFLAKYPEDFPELEYIVASAPFGAAEFATPENPINVFYFTPVLNRPASRGNVSISSANMRDQPLINPNLLSTETDEQVLVAAFRRARDIFAASSFQPVLIGEELLPGRERVPDSATDAEILEYLKAENSGFTWHASCTCKMGKSDDPLAVLDSKARVYGVKNLRVVDISAFPLLNPGHPMSLIFALAEKISEDILQGR
jgi:choline dehydrogenase